MVCVYTGFSLGLLEYHNSEKKRFTALPRKQYGPRIFEIKRQLLP